MLPYARRVPRRGLSWTVYEALAAAGVAAVLVFLLFAGWHEYHAGNVSTDAVQTTLVITVQSLRSQVALFKLQHKDRLPGVSPLVDTGGPFDADPGTFWRQMTQYTDIDGYTSPFKSARHCYGPYLQSVPDNALNGSKTMASAPAPGVGFVYDFVGGAGSGKVWGVDQSGALVLQ